MSRTKLVSVPIPGLLDKSGRQRNKTLPDAWNDRVLARMGEGQYAWICEVSGTIIHLDADLREKDVFEVRVEDDGEVVYTETIESTHRAIWKSMTYVFNNFDVTSRYGYFVGDDV